MVTYQVNGLFKLTRDGEYWYYHLRKLTDESNGEGSAWTLGMRFTETGHRLEDFQATTDAYERGDDKGVVISFLPVVLLKVRNNAKFCALKWKSI